MVGLAIEGKENVGGFVEVGWERGNVGEGIVVVMESVGVGSVVGEGMVNVGAVGLESFIINQIIVSHVILC